MARALVSLTSFLAEQILGSKEAFEVDEIEEDGSRHSSIELTVEPSDVSKVFGTDEGRVGAIKTLLEVRAAAIRRTVSLEVLEFEDEDEDEGSADGETQNEGGDAPEAEADEG